MQPVEGRPVLLGLSRREDRDPAGGRAARRRRPGARSRPQGPSPRARPAATCWRARGERRVGVAHEVGVGEVERVVQHRHGRLGLGHRPSIHRPCSLSPADGSGHPCPGGLGHQQRGGVGRGQVLHRRVHRAGRGVHVERGQAEPALQRSLAHSEALRAGVRNDVQLAHQPAAAQQHHVVQHVDPVPPPPDRVQPARGPRRDDEAPFRAGAGQAFGDGRPDVVGRVHRRPARAGRAGAPGAPRLACPRRAGRSPPARSCPRPPLSPPPYPATLTSMVHQSRQRHSNGWRSRMACTRPGGTVCARVVSRPWCSRMPSGDVATRKPNRDVNLPHSEPTMPIATEAMIASAANLRVTVATVTADTTKNSSSELGMVSSIEPITRRTGTCSSSAPEPAARRPPRRRPRPRGPAGRCAARRRRSRAAG